MNDASTEIISGGVAGAVGIVATQPMDTIRIRLQTSSAAQGKAYTGIIQCGLETLSTEGVRGLYKGALCIVNDCTMTGC